MDCCKHKDKENKEEKLMHHMHDLYSHKHKKHSHEQHECCNNKHEHYEYYEHYPNNHSCHDEDHIKQYKNRFFIALALTIPLFLFSKTIQGLLGFSLDFSARKALLFIFVSIIYFYAGWPFLKGMHNEIKAKKPGMMSLIGLAITVAFAYSITALFIVEAKEFFLGTCKLN